MTETNFNFLSDALTASAINVRAICAVVVNLINSDVGRAIGMFVFACAVTYILTQLKSAAARKQNASQNRAAEWRANIAAVCDTVRVLCVTVREVAYTVRYVAITVLTVLIVYAFVTVV